ncbi:MAG: response regulator transcription factor [Candidatus Melainabacteria bacterium]|nr:response regulator transcription factor [Candidatus Melainabacteria bacterium]
MGVIRIVIVEDYKLVRLGLSAILNKQSDMQVVAEASTGEQGIQLIESHKPDIVLMDLGLPGMNGIEAIQHINQLPLQTHIIVLTSHESEEEVIAALSAGAHAYCLKDIPSDRLVEVIRTVSEGAAWLDPSIASVVLKTFSRATAQEKKRNVSLANALTERELRVLELLVEGNTNSEIADELCVSVHTAKVYVSNLLEKLSVNDRVQAAVKAIKEGIVT